MSNRNHQCGADVKTKIRTKDINVYVNHHIRLRLGGFEHERNGNEYQYLLRNTFKDLDGSYRAFYTEGVDHTGSLPFDCHFDKSKQPAPKTGESDNRKDVFDELTNIMLAETNCRAKILFPYNKADNHWLVGELVLTKKGQTFSVLVLAHDPFGSGELSVTKFKELEICLKKKFHQFDVAVISEISQFTSKRQSLDDIVSSGVIVADELVKRIIGESLTLSSTYPVGAQQLRECHTKFLMEVIDDDVQSYIENISLDMKTFEESNKFVLSIDEVRSKLNKIINSNDAENKKTDQLLRLEEEYYKPLVVQLANKSSLEELKDLVIVFNDLTTLALTLSELKDKLEYLTEAAVYSQYIKTILKEKFPSELRDNFLERYACQWHDIQEKLVTEIGGKMEPNMTRDAKEYQEYVINMRNKAKDEFEMINERLKQLKESQTQENMEEHQNSFVNLVRNLFQHIAEEMKFLLAKLYSDSKNVMTISPPCRYAIIGLGSLALQQITPYSDFEFAILTELDAHKNSETMTYFKNLSYLENLKIIGLGETIIPTSKFEVDLAHLVHVGINFDLGGKTPLGRKDKPHYSLVQTVSGMLRYVYNKNDKITNIDKGLPYIMENVCYISGDNKLVEEYQNSVVVFFSQNNLDLQKNCEMRALKILKKGSFEYDYVSVQANLKRKRMKHGSDLEKLEPKFIKNEGTYFDVKKEIYRLSERMVYNLGLYYGVEMKSCWDTLNKIAEMKIINQSGHKNLSYAVSFANLLRLRTYFKNKSQTGDMSIYPMDFSSTETSMLELTEEDLGENGQLFNYFYRAYPLYKKLKEFCAEHGDLTDLEKRQFFQNELFFDSASKTKGMIYIRLNQYDNALKHLIPSLHVSNNENRLILLEVIGDAYYSKGDYTSAIQYYKESLGIKTTKFNGVAHPDVATSLQNIGNAYDAQANYESALLYHQKCLVMQKTIHKDHPHSAVATCLNNMGNTHSRKGDYDLALEYYKDCVDIEKGLYTDASHPDVAISLDNIGTIYSYKGDYDLALEYKKQCYKMQRLVYKDIAHLDVAISLNNIGSDYTAKCDYDLALHYHKKSLEMQTSIFKHAPHPDIANSLENIGCAYASQGVYDLALQYYKESLKMRKSIYEDIPHPEIAYSLNNIGSVYDSKGDYDLALQNYQESLKIRRTVYYEDNAHPDIATSLNNIGSTYHSKGDYDLALQYYNESLKLQKNDPHPDLATSLNNLGSVYFSMGDNDLSLKYHKESLEIRKIVFKDNPHSDVANTLTCIGNAYESKGDYDLALQFFKQGLEMEKSIYKDILHPDVANSLTNIGHVYISLSEYDSALQYYEESLKLLKSYHKDAFHLDIATILDSIGSVYSSMGDNDLALKYHKESLEILKVAFKNNPHLDVANTLTNIGNAYVSKGDYDLALQFFKQSLEMEKLIHKDIPHPDVANSLTNIGGIYISLNEYDLALDYYEESLSIFKSVHKDAFHSDIATTLNNIGIAYRSKGEYDVALQYCEQCLKLERKIGKNIDQTAVAASLDTIGHIYDSKGDYDSALKYHKESLDIRKIVFKDNPHSDVANSLSNIGSAHNSKGDYDLALQFYIESLEMSKAINEYIAHPDVAAAMNNIGCIYFSLGDYDLALSYHKESLEMQKIVYKDIAHPDIVNTLSNIGSVYHLKGDYDLALQFFEECLTMEKIVQKDTSHQRIATFLKNIGLVYQSKGEEGLAEAYFKKCSDMEFLLRE